MLHFLLIQPHIYLNSKKYYFWQYRKLVRYCAIRQGMLGLVQQRPVDSKKTTKGHQLVIIGEKGMPLLPAAVLRHEYILKTCLPRYKLKAEALEAANHFVESFFFVQWHKKS